MTPRTDLVDDSESTKSLIRTLQGVIRSQRKSGARLYLSAWVVPLPTGVLFERYRTVSRLRISPKASSPRPTLLSSTVSSGPSTPRVRSLSFTFECVWSGQTQASTTSSLPSLPKNGSMKSNAFQSVTRCCSRLPPSVSPLLRPSTVLDRLAISRCEFSSVVVLPRKRIRGLLCCVWVFSLHLRNVNHCIASAVRQPDSQRWLATQANFASI